MNTPTKPSDFIPRAVTTGPGGALETMTGARVLACLPPLPRLDRQALAEHWQASGLARSLAR